MEEKKLKESLVKVQREKKIDCYELYMDHLISSHEAPGLTNHSAIRGSADAIVDNLMKQELQKSAVVQVKQKSSQQPQNTVKK